MIGLKPRIRARRPRRPAWLLHAAGSALAVLLVSAQAVQARGFPMPGPSGWATWQAEQADGAGLWEVTADPAAAGGQYVAPPQKAREAPRAPHESYLTFRFEAKEPTTLRVRPVWWRDGERKSARLFPYPLARLAGPDVMDECNGLVFFTAPTTGRVAIVDPGSEAVIGSIEVGGYLTDIVADRDAGRLYVADALGGRVVVIDAKARAKSGEVHTPAGPWSLALRAGTLFVACRRARCLATIDVSQRKVARTIPLSAPPISVELASGPPGRLIVRFQQQPFSVLSLASLPADEQQYPIVGRRTSASLGRDKRFSRSKAGELAIEAKGQKKTLDVRAVTDGEGAARAVEPPLTDEPGPDAMDICSGALFFTAPNTGRVGVVDAQSDALVATIRVGGHLSDLVAAPTRNKVYVADVAGNRVVVLDAKKRAIVKELKVPSQPCALAFVHDIQKQRPELVAPVVVDKVFVVCRAGKVLLAIDAATDEIRERGALPSAGRRVKAIPMPNTGWWPLLPDYKIPFALTARVAVEPAPVAFDPTTLKPVPAGDPPEAAPRRAKVTVGGKAFAADNALTLQIDGKRWLDVSSVADPGAAPERSLTARDEPGSITFAVDGGPEYDWRRGTWVTPDGERFLVSGSEEFWQYNAPRFRVGPGRHALRVRCRTPYARIDAIQVSRSLERDLAVTVLPEPRDVHSRVPLASYQGVFYDTEPIRFSCTVANHSERPQDCVLSQRLYNYMGELVDEPEETLGPIGPGEDRTRGLSFRPADNGRFTLIVTVGSPEGEVVREIHFLRLPKLQHPRLLFRRERIPEIQARIARYRALFRRYEGWLRRMSEHDGRFPERFLPAGLTRVSLGALAPEEMTNEQQREQTYGWRMYELGWRMLACEFASQFLESPGDPFLAQKIEPLLHEPKTDMYCEYHHHGPFFPGAVAALVDLAPDEVRESLPLWQFMASDTGDMNVYPWTLLTLEEPVTPEKRALLFEIMTMHNNMERQFEAHRGSRAGIWWLNPWTGCHCPMHGIFLSFLYTSNVFDEPRIFRKPFFRGFITFHRYVDPLEDNRSLLPGRRGPQGEPVRWIEGALPRHPLEKSCYPWDTWVQMLSARMEEPEEQAVDRLFDLQQMPLVGPLRGGVSYFVTGVAIPMALALGWYDPAAPTVAWDDLPPTTIFDFDGWVPMRSGWDKDATEVTFISGARDHACRHQPNHFTIVKGGEFLVGTPALYGDDGNCTPSWGNTVVVGDQWPLQWRENLWSPRCMERAVIDRFSDATWRYVERDRRLVGYKPAESGWGGGVDLHGHTETVFWRQGQIVGYETWPRFDYAAGDATNAWPAEQVTEMYRQIVFVRPDTVIVYDRGNLASSGIASKWIAATGPELSAAGSTLSIRSGRAGLRGLVLLPKRAALSAPKPLDGWLWKDQKLLQIAPAASSPDAEYLVVMRVGGEDMPPPRAAPVTSAELAGVELKLPKATVRVRFRRSGPVGGDITIADAHGTFAHDLTQTVDDTYVHWRRDPRFRAWVSDRRFDFVVPDRDIR